MQMTILQTEQELRRQGQELAVAWRRGKAAFVLDTLDQEIPMRAALLATLVHDLLNRWDPVEGRWPVTFWRAVLTRSEGQLTDEELEELTSLYKRQFGMSPPQGNQEERLIGNGLRKRPGVEVQARLIRQALDSGEPIPKPSLPPLQSSRFKRGQTELR